jgi:hypothetical protein
MPTGGGGGMQPQPTAERMHPYVWPGAPPGHNWLWSVHFQLNYTESLLSYAAPAQPLLPWLLPETIDELIDTNPKCRLFFKIDLQEYFAALIYLSANDFCQPFSLGGNFYVDSGSWVTSSQVQTRFFSSVGHCVRKVKYI